MRRHPEYSAHCGPSKHKSQKPNNNNGLWKRNSVFPVGFRWDSRNGTCFAFCGVRRLNGRWNSAQPGPLKSTGLRDEQEIRQSRSPEGSLTHFLPFRVLQRDKRCRCPLRLPHAIQGPFFCALACLDSGRWERLGVLCGMAAIAGASCLDPLQIGSIGRERRQESVEFVVDVACVQTGHSAEAAAGCGWGS